MKKNYLLILLISQFFTAQTLTIDSSLNIGTGFDQWIGFGSITVDRVIQQTDGKIIVVGQYINYNGTTSNCITRLNIDGTKDTSFITGSGTNSGIWGCLLQSDGKILIYGGFTAYNGVSSNRIVRLNANGTKDTSFAIGTGPNDYLQSAKLQSDGKLVIVGRFTSYNGVAMNKIARINSNGTLDTTFNIGSGADGIIKDVVIQSDGKVIIGGEFNNFNGVAKRRLVRLNANGSIDATYTIGTGALSNIWTMAIQSDDKLLIGGEFQQYNTVGRNRIARINTDGTLDTGFVIGTGANGTVMSLLIQSDNKIYIGGSFSSFNGSSRISLARLNSNGSLDNTLTVGSGFNDWVKSIVKQSDGKLLIGGNFTSYDNVTVNRTVRLIDANLINPDSNFYLTTIYPNPVSSELYISDSEIIESYIITGIDGKIVANDTLDKNYINVENLQNGIYVLTLFKDNTTIIKKFIKK